jgi:predicted GNAT family N-acyltransferase
MSEENIRSIQRGNCAATVQEAQEKPIRNVSPEVRQQPSSRMIVRPVASDADWQAAKAIRTAVFIEEQNCPPEEEWDAHDATSRHLLGLAEGTPIATARWRTVMHGETAVAKLERFAVRQSHRGKGHGTTLVEATIADARRAGFGTALIHAQAHLEAWYATFGFRATGRRFEEAGIPHVEMVRRAGSKAER